MRFSEHEASYEIKLPLNIKMFDSENRSSFICVLSVYPYHFLFIFDFVLLEPEL